MSTQQFHTLLPGALISTVDVADAVEFLSSNEPALSDESSETRLEAHLKSETVLLMVSILVSRAFFTLL